MGLGYSDLISRKGHIQPGNKQEDHIYLEECNVNIGEYKIGEDPIYKELPSMCSQWRHRESVTTRVWLTKHL